MEFNSISELVQELDYQERYTYEQRVDLFNKYGISTSKKYLNPVMLLSEHIRKMGYISKSHGFQYYGMSHSGAVKTNFNKQVSESRSKDVEIKNYEKFTTYKTFRYVYSSKEYENMLLFKEIKETKLVTFKIVDPESYFPKRGFCVVSWAEEFCKDFGFNINFE